MAEPSGLNARISQPGQEVTMPLLFGSLAFSRPRPSNGLSYIVCKRHKYVPAKRNVS
jgi:hypothetical protein